MSSPGIVLANARVHGVDGAVDVVVRDGRIAAIGAGAGDAGAGAVQERVDLGGRHVIPGLWDNHVHMNQWALSSQRLELGAAASALEVAQAVAERLRDEPGARGTFVGYGFRDGLWPDAPSRQLLDAVAPDRPVVLVSGDLHSCWLNSSALALYGHGDSESGLLREEACFAVVRSIDTVDDETMDAWVSAAAHRAAARGVVGVVDLEMTWNLDVWHRRMSRGFDALRVEFGVYPQHLQRAIDLGLRSGEVLGGTGGLLTVGPFKVITDGSLNTRTAYCFDPYPGFDGEGEGVRGLLTVPPDELVSLMRAAWHAGLTPAVHAIGDHANRLALDAFEKIGCRGSIEHAQLLGLSDLARFAELGVVASVQPEHAMDDRDVAEVYWAGRTDRAFALRGLVEAGATIALGSDAPVAPLDPWTTMAAAVERDRGGRAPWHPEQAIDARTALAASARGRSTIAVGEVADLAVTDRDPLAVNPSSLRETEIAATMLEGRFTYSAL
ncbi:amidohydrolase [Compostimonas suwonensis]|uniref:Amidohydrolase 3 domain-containing protein n=1 Tax=Compostimonas suwonensis TaxID=1048394 RepID=A0A2M9BZJ1_9MICO|nr:amidohydrolase family protein [Compostimonas suwonensis]PJJ63494.1 hypothetical protein CLV54_1162 [Compostimonas suwonensis]